MPWWGSKVRFMQAAVGARCRTHARRSQHALALRSIHAPPAAGRQPHPDAQRPAPPLHATTGHLPVRVQPRGAARRAHRRQCAHVLRHRCAQGEAAGELWRQRTTGLEPGLWSRSSRSRAGLGAAAGAGAEHGLVSAAASGEEDELLVLQRQLGVGDGDADGRASGGSGRSVSADGRPLDAASRQRQQSRSLQARPQAMPSPTTAQRPRPAPLVLPRGSQRSLGLGSRQLSAGGRSPSPGSEPLSAGASQQQHPPSSARSLSRVARHRPKDSL